MNSNIIMANNKQYTNPYNLPEEITSILTRSRYNITNENLGDYSTTTLVAPIQQTILMRRYPNNLRIFDVISEFWAMVGSIAHKVLEEHGNAATTEKRYYMVYNNATISGQVDHYKNGIITDYKSTKAYKIIKNDFRDWEKQLNVYRWLLWCNNLPVNKIRIFAFILDWNKIQATKKDYPQCPIVEINLPLWSIETAQAYVETRLESLMLANIMSDKDIFKKFPCSKDEMWQNVINYALTRPEAKRAIKLFNDAQEALTYPLKDGEMIVERMSIRKRCIDYCPCSTVCIQHKTLLAEKGGKNESPSAEQECIF